MMAAWSRFRDRRTQEYTPLPLTEKETLSILRLRRESRSSWRQALQVVGGLICLYGLIRYALLYEHVAWG